MKISSTPSDGVGGETTVRTLSFGPRRGVYLDAAVESKAGRRPLSDEDAGHFEFLDAVYRGLCAMLYNYVPSSGHPGGSVSSGRFVMALLWDAMDYDASRPARGEADILSYAAGHKALGLYALWALRNEVLRLGAPDLLPRDPRHQLRLEDLLGFRRNPTNRTPLFKRFKAKALDGHPTPATPFVRLSTGASGVGVASSLGLAFGAKDYYGTDAPRVHIVEGEGGLTPGRVAEALAAAGTASLGNAFLHVDWNQASIDSNRVCREGSTPGDYVQWTPLELAALHDWNVVYAPDGMDFQQIVAAQRAALALDNGQPTAVVYRTVKGWRYGIEGRASHGAGHNLCSNGFYKALSPLLNGAQGALPRCAADAQRCRAGASAEVVEECFWEALGAVRRTLERNPAAVAALAERLRRASARLDARSRKPRGGAPRVEAIFTAARKNAKAPIPPAFTLKPGSVTTLRAELGRVLNHYNKLSGGGLFVAAADLLGSTSMNLAAQGFPEGFFHTRDNPLSRVLSVGGICEDAMAGIMSGLAAHGRHLGALSSYAAFVAPLGHIAARLHAIGLQGRQALAPGPFTPFLLVGAHAGLKTGEDGPTHADPQALQLLQGNFPPGVMITLTPWEPQEIWTLLAAALARRPAVIAVFVTRPNEKIVDRRRLRLGAATLSRFGVYPLRSAGKRSDGAVVIQGSEVAYEFVEKALPRLDQKGIALDVYHVSSAELFDALPPSEQARVFPPDRARDPLGITGFTLPTMHRWIRSDLGRAMTIHPFQKGHYLGSGKADKVLEEAGLDGESQFKTIRKWLDKGKRRTR